MTSVLKKDTSDYQKETNQSPGIMQHWFEIGN